jgi:hypothetical protein
MYGDCAPLVPSLTSRRLSSLLLPGPDRFSEGPVCRNCHIYVDNAHVAVLPPKGEDEIALTQWIKNKNAKSVTRERVCARQ